MASQRFNSPDLRKPASSPRPKGRENSKDTLCRNVLIYGHCRYEDQGCAFNHDPNKTLSAQQGQQENSFLKKSLNVDSPSFQPATLSVPGKPSTISSQAVNAAPFTPRALASGTTTPNPQPEPTVPPPATFNPAAINEFTPQGYDLSQHVGTNGSTDAQVPFDPFSMNNLAQAIPTTAYNPYLEDSSNVGNNGAGYYQAQPSFSAPAQPAQYHLYAPMGPHREDLLAYQKLVHDFFIGDHIREDLQKKSAATLQVLPNSQLPVLDHYHTLVPLDTNHNKNAAVFGYPSWVYKAISSKNGNVYVLRRLEGFRLSNEKAIRPVKDWKRVDNAGVVSVIDAFTTRAFGDSSLIIVYNYHPLSKTLIEQHFTGTNRYGHRAASTLIAENVLWGYMVQIASAIKSVHSANLAVRCMDPSKIIVTDKHRIRLNACSVLDVVQFEANRVLAELQQEDFLLFGKLMLQLATNNLSANPAVKGTVEHLTRTYSTDFKDTILWLLTPAQPPTAKSIDEFISGISSHVISSYDSALHADDNNMSLLSRELENGRIARLLCKLGNINERPEYDGDVKWSEVGERYTLKLFRDYVFHQVSADGKPVCDLGHMISCLNKLDAGTDEMIRLTSRDEETIFYVTYKEIKKQVALAWNELVQKGQTPAKQMGGRY